MGSLKHAPELLQCERWPIAEMGLLSNSEIERFNVCKAAIEAVCHGERASCIARQYSISRSNLSYLLSRCVTRHPDGQLWGYRALIQGTRFVPYKRRKVTDVTPDSDGYGLAGAFEMLLAGHPKIVERIEKSITGVGKMRVREGGLNLAGLHREILEQLRKEGVGDNTYPFNTKNAGYFSLLRHVKRRLESGDNQVARHRFGQSALDGLQAGTGKKGVLHAIHPLDIACYDEQEMPFIGTLVYEIGGKELHVPLSRGHLCLLVDTDSTCVLGYSLAIAKRFRSLQLLAAYEGFLTPWRARDLSIRGMAYMDGAGLPSGVVPECHGRLINMISVDNHLTHLAESVVGHLRVRTGAAIRYGKVRHWIARQVVEGVFAELQKHSFTRLPSTTGSGPKDPSVSNPTKKAVDFRIRMDTLIELIDVVIANHNATPRRSLMAKTPLESLKSGLDEDSRLSIIPRIPDSFLADPQLAVEIITSTVRGSREKGRRPYIEIDGGKYTNDILAQSWSMIGTRLTVHIRGDFRKVRVFRENGAEFGVLLVMGHWSHTFHTREMRKEINILHREKVIDRWKGDPVKAYQDHLVHESLKTAAKNPYKISKASSKLATALHGQDPANIGLHLGPSCNEDAPVQTSLKSRGRRKFFSTKGSES